MTSPSPVHSVENVSIEIIKSHPPQLQIVAEGTVSSTGFTDAMLDETIYIDPPADGVYEYSFVATPPEEAGAPLMTPILGLSAALTKVSGPLTRGLVEK